MINNILPPNFLNATAQEASEHYVADLSIEHESDPHIYDSKVMHPHLDMSIKNRPNFPHIDQGHFKTISFRELGL